MKEPYRLFLIIESFLDETEGSWTDNQWQSLIERLEDNDIKVNEKELEKLLRREKEKRKGQKLKNLCMEFVVEKNGSWNHEQWIDFKKMVEKKGYDISDNELGNLLELHRKKFEEEEKEKIENRKSIDNKINSLKILKEKLEKKKEEINKKEMELMKNQNKIQKKEDIHKNLLEKLKSDKTSLEKQKDKNLKKKNEIEKKFKEIESRKKKLEDKQKKFEIYKKDFQSEKQKIEISS